MSPYLFVSKAILVPEADLHTVSHSFPSAGSGIPVEMPPNSSIRKLRRSGMIHASRACLEPDLYSHHRVFGARDPYERPFPRKFLSVGLEYIGEDSFFNGTGENE